MGTCFSCDRAENLESRAKAGRNVFLLGSATAGFSTPQDRPQADDLVPLEMTGEAVPFVSLGSKTRAQAGLGRGTC
jgi:hypothetical protein